uniref:E-cadherin n=1 Tax=Halisarca dujardinii TaxID=2583056 RepID=A0A410R961_HALDU|nr:E-cadherin [Halisarca dujardinii]
MYRLLDSSSPSLTSLQHFAVDTNSGWLYVAGRLDRESVPTYTLSVEAWDGTSSSTLQLTVSVADVNDNAPQFSMPSFTCAAIEGMAATVPCVSVSDSDFGSNGDILLNIVDSTSAEGVFGVSSGGDISIGQPLDRELGSEHTLTVAATDRGTPSLTAYCRVTVTVSDINDNAPTFSQSGYQVGVNESSPAGSEVLTVYAFDPDQQQQQQDNGRVSYSLNPPSSLFAVDSSTGVLTLRQGLSFVAQQRHQLTVVATDGGLTAQSATASIAVQVLSDFSSSASFLSQPLAVTLSENLPANTLVSSVLGDNSFPVYYSLSPNDRYFWIDSRTGVIRTGLGLDREVNSTYTLTASARHFLNFGTSSSVVFEVTVSDVNDNAPSPVPKSDEVTLSISESSSLSSSTLFTLQFADRDASGSVGAVAILSPQVSRYLQIDSSGRGTLMLGQLDVEHLFAYQDFLIAITDTESPSQMETYHVRLVVEDINDEAPVFSSESYQALLWTPAQPGAIVTHVSATDEDKGASGRVRFSISGGNGTDSFEIDAASGEIALSNPYSLHSRYHLQVSATDRGVPSLSSTANVYVEVRSCPILNFRFSPSEVSIVLSEAVPTGTVVVSPTLVHTGYSENDVQFTLISNDGGVFSIDRASGNVSLLSNLDRETVSEHGLAVQATHRSLSHLVADLSVQVVVEDVNDNPPRFTNTPYRAYISNNASTGSPVLRVNSNDPDLFEGGTISYHIASGDLGYFALNSVTGELTVLTSLTALQTGRSINLTVEARDQGVPVSLSSSAVVSVFVVDSRAPRFTQSQYTAEVSELADVGMFVTVVSATVFSSNGFPTYTIEAGNGEIRFSIDFYSGDVRVARALDFEERQEYTLDLKVSDPTLDETSFSLTTLVISVKDENDRAPVFSQNIYTKVLPESSDRDTLVTTLEATDADSSSSPNSAVTYSFGESYTFGGTFALNFDSGELTVDGETDYEAIQRYEIPVIAVDSGVPQQTGSATVFLSLTNINDNAPRFASSLLELSVQETAHNGSIVGSVSATDPDSDPITYSLEGTDSLFTIDAQTGEVRLQLTGSQVLSEPSYNLSVSARDGVHVGRTTVRVNVLDINDNPPAFTASTYYGNVTENDASAVNVVQVSATDADRGGVALTYTFESNTVSNFKIDANTGWISKKSGAIDREMVSEFVFNVFVQDGVYTSNAVVRVTVLDRNDNAPEFLSVSSVDVSENLPRSSLITVLEAADADQGSNAQLSFSIAGVTTPSGSSVEALPFHFEGGSNRLVLRGIVNHENTPSFTFTVVVSDAGSPSQSLSVSYTVSIVDTLDSPPHFTQSSYAFSMVEPMNYDQSVGQVMATVSDSNQFIYFGIPTTPAVPFTIGLFSGMIVATYADREVQSEYQFNVEAYVLTANQKLLKNLTSVTVTVEDINDNAPKILSFLFLGQVAENQPSGSRVLSSGIGLDVIGVEDIDNGINGTFSFQIVPLTSDAVPFIIQDDGQVLTTQTLDREGATALYMFRFVAVDKGPVAKTSEVALASIAVTDLNDSPPVFNSSAFSATVSEEASLDEEVTSIRASDADKGENANVRYSLHGSANFAIDTFTGAVRVSGALDHERQIVYNLTVDGYDGANRASVALQITVQDVNDEPPQFNVASYETTVLENSDIELPVLTVYASDVDLVGSVSYSLLSGPSRDNFTVNATGGELYFTTSPNYESAQQLVVQVVAGDGVHETLASVAVSILDQNDVTPTFPDADFEGMIFENIRAGTNVVKVSASDPDSGAGGLVQYEIIGGNAGDVLGVSVSQLPFQIAMQSGLILTTEILDREQVNHYTLHVRATDLGTPPLSSTGIVRVSVLDDNDHSPVFDRSNYSTPLSESVDDGFFVLRVRASDADSGSNAEIFYELQSGNDLGNFALDSQTGRLTVQSELDFESTRLFNLTVVAHDGGLVSLKASVSVLIEILDENDNRPTFQTKNYLHSIDENAASGSTVVTVRATDIDANAARVLYEIAEEDLIPQFEINAETGIIAIGTELDYESDREHEFRIWAYNEGDELLRDTATVTVTVGDINDEEPVFNPPNPEFSITENVFPPQSLGGVSATDPDTVTTPGDLRYSLVSSPHSSRFRLDSRTGLLTTLASFDRESVPRYRLVVTASDGGSPSQTGTTTVTVTILDVNDNVPQPANAAIFIYLAGEHFSSAAVGQVNANDPDLFNAHTYSLLSDPSSNMGSFSLHFSNGSIQAPDNPMPGSYNFVVNVTENGNWAKCTVAIQVSEINPNMAANSVTLRVTQTTAENFLANKFTGFSKMDIFGSQVPTSTRPFVVSVQDVLGADDTVDVSFAVEQEGGSFVGQELLRHLVHSNRISFSNLGIRVQTEQLDLCANEPCGLNGICQNVLGPVQRQLVSLSPPRTIVASAPTWGYRCTCLRGVSGRNCTQGSVDLCAYASCLPPSVCGNAPGERRAVCQCPDGSRLQRGICVANETACAALSCLNGASCAVQREGLACRCLDGFRGPKCQIAEPHPARCATANCLHNSSCTASSEGATCTCLPGYSGLTCANRADPNKPKDCSLNPCLYGGTCSPASGGAGYACACAGGFTGQDCEADLYGAVTQAPTSACDGVQCPSSEYCRTDGGDGAGVCVNPCLPNPCANGGSCVKRDSGWTCSCLPGHFGPLCEVPQGRFGTRGSVVHPSIDTPLNGSVYLEFAASSTYGLLFLNGRYDDHYSDFIVLELLGGFLKYTVSRGGQRYDVEFTSRDLADQQWHSVEAGYNLTHMWLTVDDCGGSGSVAFGPLGRVRGPLERPICEQTVATVDDYTSHVSLDVSGPLVLGYHRASYNYTFGESFSFSYRGYLRNVRVGGRVVDFARPLSTGGDVHSSLGLEGRPDCAASPCRNGAECLQDGFRYSCLCSSSFSGDNCERASSSVGFPGNTVVTFTLLSNSGPTGTTTKRQTSFYSSTSTVLSLGFSTTSPNGVLFALVGPTDYAYLEMVDGFLQFRFNLGLQEATASIDGVRMYTGDFHDVEARREGRTAQLVVDRMFVATASVPGDDRSLDVPAEGIYLGAGSGVGVGGVVQNPFNGCIRGAKLDGKELPLSDDSFDVNFQVSLPSSSSSSDSSLSFSCWVPPKGPIGAVPVSPSLPLFVIIIIAVCATFALALLLCIVAALIARCRHGSLVKTSSGGFELQQRDFAGFRQMGLRPTNSAIPGRPNSGAGNVRNYAQEGGGESDIHDNGELESIISSPNLTVNSHPTTNHTLSVEPNSVTATTSMTERLRITVQPLSHPVENSTLSSITQPSISPDPQFISQPSRSPSDLSNSVATTTPTSMLAMLTAVPENGERWRSREDNPRTAAVPDRSQLIPTDCRNGGPERSQAATTSHSRRTLGERVQSPVPVHPPEPQLATGERKRLEAEEAESQSRPDPAVLARTPAKPQPASKPKPKPKKASRNPEVDRIWQLKKAADRKLMRDNNFDDTHLYKEEGSLTPMSSKSLESLYHINNTSEEYSANVDFTNPQLAHLRALLQHLDIAGDDDDDESSIVTAVESSILPSQSKTPPSSILRPPPLPDKFHSSSSVTVREV